MPRFLDLVDIKLKSLAPENIQGTTRLLQLRGKRLRPSLVIAIAFLCGKEIDERVINAASAVELVHLASLIHDDIIDDGTLRWGKPTISSKEGVNSAVLAGDYLFAKGCALACTVDARAGELMAETIADLCNGQAKELESQFDTERTVESLASAFKGKTSSMFIAACFLGGIVSELDPFELESLARFAESFGIYYQYKDDISDFIESPQTTGKSVGNDVREGNYTLPVILALQGRQRKTLMKLLKDSDVSATKVLKILKKDDAINKTLTIAETYKDKALFELQSLKNEKIIKALTTFCNHF